MSKFYLINVDRATPELLDAIHSSIKANTDSWWHHQAASWIVEGHSTFFWRDLASEKIEGAEEDANVLVLRLPSDTSARGWGFYGAGVNNKTKWFSSTYKPKT
jgi:hypothetical protein